MKTALALLLFTAVAHADVKLANGLRVIVAPDPTVNSIVVYVRYGGGFAEDDRTIVLDQLFADAAHDDRLDTIGGYTVSNYEAHHTDVFEVVPSGALELALWFEADRMGHLAAALSQERTDAAKTAAIADYRAAKEGDDAYTHVDLEIEQALWPTRNHRRSEPSRTEAITLDQLRSLVRARLVPANATLVIAGRIDAQAAIAMVRRYFEWITPGSATALTKDAPVSTPHAAQKLLAYAVGNELPTALVIEQLAGSDAEVRGDEELRLRDAVEATDEQVRIARRAAETKLLTKLESLPYRARQLAAGGNLDRLREQIRAVTSDAVRKFLR